MSTVWVEGVEEMNRLSRDLGALADGALPLARLAIKKTCIDIKADASAVPDAGGAPRDTGYLSSSISYETRELAYAAIGEVGPTADYGSYVEFGTARQAPQAYMGPAFDRRSVGLDAALSQIADRFGR